MSVREDLRVRTCTPDEWVVGRNSAIVADSQNLADVIVEQLREERLVPAVLSVVLDVIVHRQIDHAVGPKDGAARHRPTRHPGVDFEYLLYIEERRALEPRPSERARQHVVGTYLDVVEVNEAVRSKLGVHDDRPERTRVDTRRWPTRERCSLEHAVTNDAHAAR